MKMRALGGDVSLLDYSAQSLALMRGLMRASSVKLIMGDARLCPFKDGVFDIVFHQGLLEHFPSPHALLHENHRILKKNGFLVVDVPQTFHFYTAMKHILILLGAWFGGWERQFTFVSLSRLLRRSGFQPVSAYGDWSRPGILYKILRQILMRFNITLPMYPRYLGNLTRRLYELQERIRRKRILLYTVLSVGVIARKP
jgi:ubiquinone/menaquinone biosynthesis C-methylase UbiE